MKTIEKLGVGSNELGILEMDFHFSRSEDVETALRDLKAIKAWVDANRENLVAIHESDGFATIVRGERKHWWALGTSVYPTKESHIKSLTIDFNDTRYSKLERLINALEK